MAKKWLVTLPIVGSVEIEVEADDEKSAVEKALRTDPFTGEETWDTIRCICEGNVCHAPVNRASAELLDDE